MLFKVRFQLVATVVALTLLLPGLAIGYQAHKSVNRLKKGLKSVKQSKAQAQRELRKVKKKANVVAGDITEVEERLDDLQASLEETTQSLDGARVRQKLIAAELVKASKQLEKGRAQIGARLKQMYTRRQENFLTVLVSSQNTGEIASRKFLLERVAKKDREMFNAYARYQRNVKQKQKEQLEVVGQVARLAQNQMQQQEGLEDVKAEKKELLSDLQSKQSELQKMIEQFEADERAIASDIQAALRRARSEAKRTGKPMKQFGGGRFTRPVNGRQTSGFGMRFHPILHRNKMHTGFDFGAKYGSAVFAAGEGTVISTSALRGYGNTIIVDHGGGIATVYAHLSRINVGNGSHVNRGQHIGAVGSTGLSTGPHLHFEVRVNGSPVNPGRYL